MTSAMRIPLLWWVLETIASNFLKISKHFTSGANPI